MDSWNRKVAREHLDKKLTLLKNFASLEPPPQGWMRTIREALGMSSSQLGKRAGLDQSRISRLEKAETCGNLKLSSLKKIAKALGMKFVYGFVPRQTLEKEVRTQARVIALKRLQKLSTTMGLEKQGLPDEEQKKALETMIEKIMIAPPKDFWNDPHE
ncbi:MAG: mobile mystery protein A [Chlamydiae bacterium]|nr:mobile mystery protein A [Chlamydiota bacterium]MBI3265653.1 mobile mystery protein A [Chlamydiota bacterium]